MTKRRSSSARTPQKPKITLASSFFVSPSKKAPATPSAISYVGSTSSSSNQQNGSKSISSTPQSKRPSSSSNTPHSRATKHVEEEEVDHMEFSDHEDQNNNNDSIKLSDKQQGHVSSLTLLKQKRQQEQQQQQEEEEENERTTQKQQKQQQQQQQKRQSEIKTPERKTKKKKDTIAASDAATTPSTTITTPQKKQLSLDRYTVSPVSSKQQLTPNNKQSESETTTITTTTSESSARKIVTAPPSPTRSSSVATTSTVPRKDANRQIISASAVVNTSTKTTTTTTSAKSLHAVEEPSSNTVSVTSDVQQLQSNSTTNQTKRVEDGAPDSSQKKKKQPQPQQQQQHITSPRKATESRSKQPPITISTRSKEVPVDDDIVEVIIPSSPSPSSSITSSNSLASSSSKPSQSAVRSTSTTKSSSSAVPIQSVSETHNKAKIISADSTPAPKSTSSKSITTHADQPTKNGRSTNVKVSEKNSTTQSSATTKSAAAPRPSTSKSKELSQPVTTKPKIILASQIPAKPQQAQQPSRKITTASTTSTTTATNNNKKRPSSSDARKGNKRGRKKRRVDSDYETSEDSESDADDTEVIVATKRVSSGGRSTRSSAIANGGQRQSSTRMSRSALTELEQNIEDVLEQMIIKMINYYEKAKRSKRDMYDSEESSDESEGEENGESDEDVFIPPSSYMNDIDLNASDTDSSQQSKRLFVARWPNREICIISGQNTEDALSKLEDMVETSGAVLMPYNGDVFLDFKRKHPLYEDASKSKTIDIGDIPNCPHHLLDCFLSGAFSDLELQVKGKKFKVHKIVLSQYPYFTEKSLQDCSRISLDALGFTPNVIRLILLQMYTLESIPLPHITSEHKFQMWKTLLIAAKSFGLLRLKRMLERAIAEQLDLCSLTTGLSNGGLNSTNPFNGVIGSIPKSERIQFYVDTANFALRHDAHKLLRYLLSNMSKHCQVSELQEAQLEPDLIERVRNWKPADNQVWSKGFADHLNSRFDYELKASSTSLGSRMWQNIEQKLFPVSASLRPRSKRAINSRTRKQRLKNAITREDSNALSEYSQRRDENIENNFDLNQYAPILLRIAGDNEDNY